MPRGYLCASSRSPLLVHLFLPSSRYRFPTRNRIAVLDIAVSLFSRGTFVRVNTFSFTFLLAPPHKSLNVPPPSHCFLPLAFPLFVPVIFFLSCTPHPSRWTVTLLRFCLHPPLHSRLRYSTIFQLALGYLLQYSRISYGWHPLLLTFVLPFQRSSVPFLDFSESSIVSALTYYYYVL